ncbi:MAG: hypothetical protein DRN96_09655 [Thermoproteota archaeon]|nr:MAG: hypothetical protein DRN96_09655 [Candidatus Korarchaeota archaeon]
MVAAESTGARELLQGPHLGCLVPQRSPSAIAQAILELHTDPRRRREIAEAARRVAENFTWDRIAERQSRLYKAVAGASASSGSF